MFLIKCMLCKYFSPIWWVIFSLSWWYVNLISINGVSVIDERDFPFVPQGLFPSISPRPCDRGFGRCLARTSQYFYFQNILSKKFPSVLSSYICLIYFFKVHTCILPLQTYGEVLHLSFFTGQPQAIQKAQYGEHVAW